MSISKTTKEYKFESRFLHFLPNFAEREIIMNYTDSGTLTVKTYTAGGALPVAESVVRVIGVDTANEFIEFSVITDRDGITPKLVLSAPSKSESLSPAPSQIPYAQYNIEITADGFYPKRIENVALFSGVDTYQSVNMIPLAVYEKGVEFPRDTLTTTVEENPYL